MTITAVVIADSVSSVGVRLTTLQLRYPRWIHSEFLNHRVFSRNASSSRAIPVERLIEDVLRDPATPTFWGKNQAGMQAREENLATSDWGLPEGSLEPVWAGIARGNLTPQDTWLYARDRAIELARQFVHRGYHKQIVNRLMEPFSHINVVVTATEWDNFFALRCHPDAQPEMRALAEAIRDARTGSTPSAVAPGEWHLPYIRDTDQHFVENASVGHELGTAKFRSALVWISAARCARVSYLTRDGREPSVEEDLRLYDRLASAVPMHASPMEHQATPDEAIEAHRIGDSSYDWAWRHKTQHGNFTGWRQHRKILESHSRP